VAGGLPCCLLGRRRTAAGAVAEGLLLAPGDEARRCGGGGAWQAGLHFLWRTQPVSPEGRNTFLHSDVNPRFNCRLEELDDIGREWRSLAAAAHELDRRLQATPFHTLCHGDFKTEVRCPVKCLDHCKVWSGLGRSSSCACLDSSTVRVCVSAKSIPLPSLQNMLFSDPSGGKCELEAAACECGCAL